LLFVAEADDKCEIGRYDDGASCSEAYYAHELTGRHSMRVSKETLNGLKQKRNFFSTFVIGGAVMPQFVGSHGAIFLGRLSQWPLQQAPAQPPGAYPRSDKEEALQIRHHLREIGEAVFAALRWSKSG